MRTLPLVALLFFTSALRAGELPKDITPEARAAWIKKWQPSHAAERDKRQAKVDDARALAKFTATKKEGEKLLAEATAAMKDFEARPWLAPESPIEIIGEKEPTTGAVGGFAVAGGEFAIAETVPGGTLVECAVPRKGVVVVARFVIASPVEAPKKKDATIKLPGMWYCAGTTDVRGKTVPVLYRFELKKDDFPPKK